MPNITFGILDWPCAYIGAQSACRDSGPRSARHTAVDTRRLALSDTATLNRSQPRHAHLYI